MKETLIPKFPVSEITINKSMNTQTRVKGATVNTGLSTDIGTQIFELVSFSKSCCSECKMRDWRPCEYFI